MDNVRIVEERGGLFGVCPAQESMHGVLHVLLKPTSCPGAEKDRHLHLLKAKLFPASITRPHSAFTFDILDNFLIDALDYDIFTNNAFPDKIPDCYRELMRVSRIWRDLVNRIRFGFMTPDRQIPWSGDLALYCPACPQPGINLPPSWKDSYDAWLVMQRYIVNGNFTAQHMKMKTPEDDVSLADGKGYMVTEEPYQNHITESVEEREKSSCSIGSALIIYDVACQWSIHFHERVDRSYHLSLPQLIEILPAIGKFHLSAHKLLCFPRFSLNFITGAVLDDHMRDSNWKKLVGIGKSS
ncbi:hypothetical protein EDB19DRAFT_1898193 [Suillus lakei]|nr:hypothetical protein EDB19DRAFT_1898193 [Suillus lakei]